MDDLNIDAWYKLAAAVVRGIEDPDEREAWRELGDSILARLDRRRPLRTPGAVGPGHMNPIWTEPDGRTGNKRTRGRGAGSARISARDRGRQ